MQALFHYLHFDMKPISIIFANDNQTNTVMPRKLTSILLLLASATTLSAQDMFDNPDNSPYFGARISYELACPGDVTTSNDLIKTAMFGNGSGFSIGGIYNIPLWKNLFFEPGVSLYYNTYSLNRDLLRPGFLDQTPTIDNASMRQWGLRIPVNFGYRFDFTPDIAVSFFTGPEINLSFKGNLHFSIDNSNITTPAFGKKGYLNRADIKWRFGVAATIFDHYYFALSGAAGMCNLIRSDFVSINPDGFELTQKMHSNLFSLTLGYNF